MIYFNEIEQPNYYDSIYSSIQSTEDFKFEFTQKMDYRQHERYIDPKSGSHFDFKIITSLLEQLKAE